MEALDIDTTSVLIPPMPYTPHNKRNREYTKPAIFLLSVVAVERAGTMPQAVEPS